MAKFDLKFIDSEESSRRISVSEFEGKEISITINTSSEFKRIYLDKSTAIKFAKTLRTEINKIED